MNEHEVIVRDERAIVPQTIDRTQTALFMPKDGKELWYLAQRAAQTGMYGWDDANKAFLVMLQGAHLGISPLQALGDFHFIKGKPVPSARLQAGLIHARGGVTKWVVESTATHCRITLRRRGHSTDEYVEARLEDVPKQLKANPNWANHPEDMLYATCVRRAARRHFPDVFTMLGVSMPEPVDEMPVIDVGEVEQVVGRVIADPCPRCGTTMRAITPSAGGMFMACDKCGHREAPAQDVRDAIRGKSTHKEDDADDPTRGDVVVEAVPAGTAENGDGVTPPALIEEHYLQILREEAVTLLRRMTNAERMTFLKSHGFDHSSIGAWLAAMRPVELENVHYDLTSLETA